MGPLSPLEQLLELCFLAQFSPVDVADDFASPQVLQSVSWDASSLRICPWGA